MNTLSIYSSCPWATLFLQDLPPLVVGGREHRNREEQVPLCITMAVKNFFLLVFSASLAGYWHPVWGSHPNADCLERAVKVLGKALRGPLITQEAEYCILLGESSRKILLFTVEMSRYYYWSKHSKSRMFIYLAPREGAAVSKDKEGWKKFALHPSIPETWLAKIWPLELSIWNH